MLFNLRRPRLIMPLEKFVLYFIWQCINWITRGPITWVATATYTVFIPLVNVLFVFSKPKAVNLYFSNPTITATSIMIPYCFLMVGSDYIELMWRLPLYRPERYELTYLCIIKCTPQPISRIDYIINSTMLNISSHVTNIRIRNLCPNTMCILRLITVYNPASIDSGIVLTSKTLSVNTSKCTFGREVYKCTFNVLKYIFA